MAKQRTQFGTLQKLAIVGGVLFILGIIFFQGDVLGDAKLNVSLRTNPNLDNGLVGYWTLDGKDTLQNASDLSGQGHTGYLTGFTSTTTVTGRIGQALNFDGVDDYITAGNVGTVNSISFWVKPDSTTKKILNLNSVSTDTGLKSPSATGEDYNQWTTPSNAFSSDNAYATEVTDDEKQDWYNFSLGVPAGATIAGIEVDVEASSAGAADRFATEDVELSWDGGASYTSSAKNFSRTNPSTDSTSVLGGSSDPWGRTWSASDFSDGNFRLRLNQNAASNGATIQVDQIQVKVYYTSIQSIEVSGGTVTANGFDSPTVYVDGVVASTIDTQWHHVVITDATGGSASAVEIGRISSGYFDGTLDDVRLYNRVLSPAEILRLYHLGATTKIATTISTNPNNSNGLVAWWTLDALKVDVSQVTAEVRDSVGSFHGDWKNHATTTVPGRVGQGINFDGVNDIVSVSDNDAFSPSAMTVSFWMKSSGPINTGLQYDFLGKYSNPYEWRFYAIGSSNLILFLACSDSSDCDPNVGRTANVASTYFDQQWHHFVGVWDGGTAASSFRIYIDGVQADNGNQISGTFVSLPNSTSPVTIGSLTDINRTAAVNPFPGSMDDVRFYNRALSGSEIQRLYGLGATTKIATTLNTNPNLSTNLVGWWTFDGKDMYLNVADKSGSGNTGYLQGFTSTTTAPGRIGQGLSFDGTDDYVDAGSASSLNITDDLTIAAWVKPRRSIARAIVTWEISGSQCSTSVSPFPFWFLIQVSGVISLEQCVGTTDSTVSSTGHITVNQWNHVVATRSGTSIHLYINGSDAGSGNRAAGTVTSGTETMKMGRNGPNYFDGIMDDIRIYNRALSASEVLRLYQLGI